MNSLIRVSVLAGLCFLGLGSALGQQFPNRPIRIVVPYPVGGASDITARLLADKYAAAWGTNVIVDNRTGANGIIGTDIVAKARPDGYTLGLAGMAYSVNPSIHQKLPYDTAKDLAAITITASVPIVLLVTNNLPVKNVRELIALAKSKPKSLSFASSGAGSSPHLTMELFMMSTGIELNHVPYKGSTQAHPDVITGQVQVMFDTIVSAVPLIKAGRVRALGVSTLTRSRQLPDIPTVSEAGVPNFESGSWGVLFGPANIPAPTVEKLAVEAGKILKSSTVHERLTQLGADPIGNSADEARRYVNAEQEKWKAIIKRSGLTSER